MKCLSLAKNKQDRKFLQSMITDRKALIVGQHKHLIEREKRRIEGS